MDAPGWQRKALKRLFHWITSVLTSLLHLLETVVSNNGSAWEPWLQKLLFTFSLRTEKNKIRAGQGAITAIFQMCLSDCNTFSQAAGPLVRWPWAMQPPNSPNPHISYFHRSLFAQHNRDSYRAGLSGVHSTFAACLPLNFHLACKEGTFNYKSMPAPGALSHQSLLWHWLNCFRPTGKQFLPG